jgi:hypothetical protein
MLDNLNELVKESTQEAIVNNSAIPNEQNDAAVSAASGSIVDALKQQLSSGNIGNLIDTFKGGNAEGSVVAQDAASGFTDKLTAMGINMDTAKGIAASVIPLVVGKLVNKTNDPNDDSFNIQDLISRVSGPDGKFDVSDVTRMFTEKTDVNGDGKDDGMIDKLKGLFN